MEHLFRQPGDELCCQICCDPLDLYLYQCLPRALESSFCQRIAISKRYDVLEQSTEPSFWTAIQKCLAFSRPEIAHAKHCSSLQTILFRSISTGIRSKEHARFHQEHRSCWPAAFLVFTSWVVWVNAFSEFATIFQAFDIVSLFEFLCYPFSLRWAPGLSTIGQSLF